MLGLRRKSWKRMCWLQQIHWTQKQTYRGSSWLDETLVSRVCLCPRTTYLKGALCKGMIWDKNWNPYRNPRSLPMAQRKVMSIATSFLRHLVK